MESGSLSIPSLQIKAPGGQPPIPKFASLSNPLPTPSFLKKVDSEPNAFASANQAKPVSVTTAPTPKFLKSFGESGSASGSASSAGQSQPAASSQSATQGSQRPSLLAKTNSSESISSSDSSSQKEEKKSRKPAFLASFRKGSEDSTDTKTRAGESPVLPPTAPKKATKPMGSEKQAPFENAATSSATEADRDSSSDNEAVANFGMDSDVDSDSETHPASDNAKSPSMWRANDSSSSSQNEKNVKVGYSTAPSDQHNESRATSQEPKRKTDSLQSIVVSRRSRYDEAQKLFSATTFPETFQLSNISDFVSRVPLVNQIVSCVITRNQNEFSCVLDTVDQVVILSAYRTNTVSGSSYFVRTDMKQDFCDGTQMVIKSNLMRTKFVVHSSSKLDDMIAHIEYTVSQPRQIMVTFYNDPVPLNRVGGPSPVLLNSCWRLKSNPPVYDTRQKAYGLRFGPRVKVASCKNFQLVHYEKKTEEIFMEFGKHNADSFALDYKAPLNAIQAFFVSLTVFDALSV